MPRNGSGSTGGFTLIEVIVALAILSLAVVAAIQGFAQGLRLLKVAGDHQYATLLADQKAREIVTPEVGRASGEDDHSGHVFTWETVTTELPTPELVGDGTRPPAWRVFEIAVRVRWDERREVQLVTLRTTPVTVETVSTTGASGTRSGTSSTTAPTDTAPATASGSTRGSSSRTRTGTTTVPGGRTQ